MNGVYHRLTGLFLDKHAHNAAFVVGRNEIIFQRMGLEQVAE